MEMLGVFALCFFGGASCIAKAEAQGNLVSVALCHMFVLAALIYVGAATSGGHYNPAVTLGLMITGKIWWWHAVLYFIFQTLGSLLAGILLRYSMTLPGRTAGGLGYPRVHDGQIGPLKAMLCEMICTFTLVFMVFALAVDKRASKFVGAMCIGGSLGAAVLAIGPISGAALNPMRWFGPCLMGKLLCDCDGPSIAKIELAKCRANCEGLEHFWVYLGGPLLGGILAALLYNFLLLTDQPTGDEEEHEKLE